MEKLCYTALFVLYRTKNTKNTKNFLGSSGCWTRPLKTSGYGYRLTQIGENRKVVWFGVDGTNQTKEGIRGRKPASKKFLGRAIFVTDMGLCVTYARVLHSFVLLDTMERNLLYCPICARAEVVTHIALGVTYGCVCVYTYLCICI